MAEAAYKAALASVRRSMACLRLEVSASVANDVDTKVMAAILAAYNLGFIDGIRTNDEFVDE